MNLSYESCKQLKDAGFPGSETWEDVRGQMCIRTAPEARGYFRGVPNLSELIEACGRRVCLYVNGDLAYADVPGDAGPHWADGYKGSTPEEAVTNLWLQLNKK